MNKLINNSFTRFVAVGILNTVIGISFSYLCLNLLKLGYWPSTFIGNTLGAVNSFILNKTFTFKSNKSLGQSTVRFIIVILICYFISYYVSERSITYILNSIYSGLSENLINNINVLFGAGIYTITNYLGQKYFAFNDSV